MVIQIEKEIVYAYKLRCTVIINKVKYFRSPFIKDLFAISAADVITGPNIVGPASETLKRALMYAVMIPWIPCT